MLNKHTVSVTILNHRIMHWIGRDLQGHVAQRACTKQNRHQLDQVVSYFSEK